MRGAMPSEIFDASNRPRYEVRVRAQAFLWGSDKLAHDLVFDRPLVLHIRNDAFGEDMHIDTLSAGGTTKTVGTLRPGECVSLPVQNIIAVRAACASETLAGCIIMS